MARNVCPRLERYTFADSNFVDLSTILGYSTICSLELRSETGDIIIKDTISGKTDTYESCDIYQLHENYKGSINGYNIGHLQVSGIATQEVIAEFAI